MKYLPKLTEIADDQWVLEDNDLVVESLGYTLVVPVGFQTDLASIPRWLWPVMAPFELGSAAPIIHDWIYRHGGFIRSKSGLQLCFSRAQADLFLRDISEQDGMASWRCNAAYAGVRVGGHWSWKTLNNNTK